MARWRVFCKSGDEADQSRRIELDEPTARRIATIWDDPEAPLPCSPHTVAVDG